VKTNIPFLENVIADPTVPRWRRPPRASLTPIRICSSSRSGKDRATKLLNYIADAIGERQSVRERATRSTKPLLPRRMQPKWDHAALPIAKGTKQLLTEMGPEKFCKEWVAKQKRLLDHRHHHARRASVAAGHAHENL